MEWEAWIIYHWTDSCVNRTGTAVCRRLLGILTARLLIKMTREAQLSVVSGLIEIPAAFIANSHINWVPNAFVRQAASGKPLAAGGCAANISQLAASSVVGKYFKLVIKTLQQLFVDVFIIWQLVGKSSYYIVIVVIVCFFFFLVVRSVGCEWCFNLFETF